MSNSNNPYPDLSNQPLLAQPVPPPPRTNNYNAPPNNYQPHPNNIPPYNPQGYSAQNQTFQQPYLPPHQAIHQGNPPQGNQGFQQNQGIQGNQGFQPSNNQGFQPNNQGFAPNGQLHCPFCGRWT